MLTNYIYFYHQKCQHPNASARTSPHIANVNYASTAFNRITVLLPSSET